MKKKIIDYKMCTHDRGWDLELEIRQLLNEGWELFNKTTVVQYRNEDGSGAIYTQALVKYE